MKLALLILKNVPRNLLRTTLTALGTMVLVFVVTLVWSILYFLDQAMSEKSSDFKAIVTERWQIPSQMPFTYARSLSEGAARSPEDIRPTDSMTWQFFGGTLDAGRMTRENLLFAFAMDPTKLTSMMDELDSLPADQAAQLEEGIAKMKAQRNAIIVGQERLKAINKRVGERFTLTGMNYKDIELEFEIVDTFPQGRYDNSAVMNREYLNEALDSYPRTHGGQPHPLAEKSLNLVWIRVPDSEAFSKISGQILDAPFYGAPAVKVETASSGIAAFLEAYRDLIWGMRWLLSPAILITMSLVIANAISISVRERHTEIAVLKVLGFRPPQVLILVLGEALLIGVGAGLASAGLTYAVVNHLLGGIAFPIAFFPAFLIPVNAVWWGFGVGALTALAGSLGPAWTASRIKVSDVFAKVA